MPWWSCARRFARIRRHALLRHHAAITLLRHGEPADIRDFFEGVLKVDAHDAFARFVMTLLDQLRRLGRAAGLVDRAKAGWSAALPDLASRYGGRRLPISACRYFCASLLSPQQPAGAGAATTRSTSRSSRPTETEKMLRAEPLFRRLEELRHRRFRALFAEISSTTGRRWSAGYGNENGPLLAEFAGLLLRTQLQVRPDVMRPLRGAGGGPGDRRVGELAWWPTCRERRRAARHGETMKRRRCRAGPCPPAAWQGSFGRSSIGEFRDADGVLRDPVRRLQQAARQRTCRKTTSPTPAVSPIRLCEWPGASARTGCSSMATTTIPYCLRPKALDASVAVVDRPGRQPVHRPHVARHRSDPPRAGCQHRQPGASTTIRSSSSIEQ